MTSPANKLPVGSVRVRTFSRTKDQRAFVKVAEPNVWRLRAHIEWERANGRPVPKGYGVHHADRNKLNDAPTNLELVTKAEHLDEHRAEFQARGVAGWVKARREQRWSTKSKTKRTGAPPKWSDEQLAAALAAIANGMGPTEASRKFGINRTTLHRRRRSTS